MNVIKPIQITSGNLTSSTIPEPDASVGEVEWSAGTIALGVRRIKAATHLLYEVVADPSTTDDPEVGVLATPATWAIVQPTNKYAMFDNINSTISIDTDLTVVLNNGAYASGMAGFNILAGSINVTCVSASDGEVYNRDIEMTSTDEVIDWAEFFFAPIVTIDQFLLNDIPLYSDLTTTVSFAGTDVQCGTLVSGPTIDLGVALYGTSWQGLDFSKKETDQFGNTVLTAGKTYDRLDYNVHTDKQRFGYLKQQLRSLTGIPAVWFGNPQNVNDGTATLGYYVDNQVNINNPVKLDVSLTVESFI